MIGAQRANRRRIAILVVSLCFGGLVLFVGYQGVQTLRLLTRIERDRDQWQRPSEILQQLNVTEGSVVVDLGSGAGYFALKLSPMVGTARMVVAEDIRRESLAFLWIRRFLRNARNVRVVHGEPNDPRLPPIRVDAVLIANTYHELSQPKPILNALFHAMTSGGRLVIVDRRPRADGAVSRQTAIGHHELSPDVVVREIRQEGFEAVSREDQFIDRPEDDDVWWLLVARKP